MMLHRVMLLSAVLATAGGCQFERLFYADAVAAGVARLSVRNSAKLVAFVDADTRCGFASDDVKYGYKQEGETGALGTVTWTVKDCALDFGNKPKDVSSDCNGAITRVSGSAKVNATRTVTGTLTGNPETPVIPASADAVLLHLEADVDDYEVRISDRDTVLLMRSGNIEIDVGVPVAQSASLGVCAVPTSDATLHRLLVKNADVHVVSGQDEFDVDTVPFIDIKGQIGRGETGPFAGKENYIEGTSTVWDHTFEFPKDDRELDTDYDSKEFRDSFTCTADLAEPLSYECLPLTPKLAEGTAKLTINTVGQLMATVVSDARCGFASPDVLANVVVEGEVGRASGMATYTITTPCVMAYPTKTQLSEDCSGKQVSATGTATVTGTMRVRGRVTGNPAQPIIPTSNEPVELAYDIAFDHFEVSDNRSANTLEILEGSLTGGMRPMTAQDALTGACSIATPVVSFDEVTWRPGATALVRTDGMALKVTIGGGVLDAVNGNRGDRENHLAGNITVEDEAFAIPLDGGEPVLDPAYDGAAFDESYACTANMVRVRNSEQCNFNQVIADGAARLIIQTAGTLASLVNSSEDCGFADTYGVLLWPDDVTGGDEEPGSMTWSVDDCGVGSGDLTVYQTDCTEGLTYLVGTANVDARRTVSGLRWDLAYVVPTVIPQNSNSVHIWLDNVELNNFVSYPVAAGADGPLGVLTIHSGTLSALVEPATGQRTDEPSQYDVATPVARLTDVVLRNAHATLEASGMRFVIDIAETHLNATNGATLGQENVLDGTLVLDGTPITINAPLNPDYDRAAFDASYVCTDNLLSTL